MNVNTRDADAPLLARRILVFALLAASWIGLGLAMAAILAPNGWTPGRILVLILFLFGAPWSFLVFWNSLIGLFILLAAPNPATLVNPTLAAAAQDPSAQTAICIAIRNEDPARVLLRVEAMIESLAQTGFLHAFAIHILSDSDAAHAQAEQTAVEALRQRHPTVLHYRRRLTNEGFKAGNLQAFAATSPCEIMIVLDADSLMSGAALLRLVRVMQAHPTLGILQTLVVGRPADSAFARVFQFGMRHGMRSHTIGAAWWQGPSGPFWGHNAAIRVAPFAQHCAMPTLPGAPPLGGPVLSHDQVEAAMMRAAGWEVRVIADECGSWEENPPSLPDFIRRNLRWCQGNLQYIHLVARPGFRPMGRYQLANALLMYVGPVAWTAMLLAGILSGAAAPAFAAYLFMLALGFLPRLFGVIDALRRPASRQTYGGAPRLLAGCLADALGTLLTLPVTMISEAIFVVAMLLGHRITWDAQQRDERAVPLREAATILWPQTLAGLAATATLAATAPEALPWAAPVLLSWTLAIPYACLSASPALGRWMRAKGLCAVPDERNPDPILNRLTPAA